MALTTKDIANFIRVTAGLEHQPPVLYALHVLLIRSLSPSQKKAYDLVLEEDYYILSQTLRGRFGWSINYAGNVLKSLRDLGLVERRREGGTRNAYLYRASKRCLGWDEIE